ncbi:TRAFs-binding domain-containing protein [Methylocella tundrae]|uniref:TRAFs-binding domain-containing protein n=1 Tax=Methylocella tundrae TaxID=227605 RepID=UPI001AEF1F6B|nr:TRAFs-binding domain-containing protein [Methylocella tundrae]WPP04226.1 TRAFs-binding domain-containing protein [Methylocella tundrae]
MTNRLKAVLARFEVDSPVFLFLPQLPHEHAYACISYNAERKETTDLNIGFAAEVTRWADGSPWFRPAVPSLADLRNAFEKAKAEATTPQKWRVVAERLQDWRNIEADDPFVVQQLAFATYKSEHPDKIAALEEAKRILTILQPQFSSDAETVGLWGAIHKHLWETLHSPVNLDEAIRSYARGFYLRGDHYNGVNLAFLLDARANQSTGDEAIADQVFAARVRREVLAILDQEFAEAKSDSTSHTPEEIYWLRASRAEALFGLGRREEANLEFQRAGEANPQPKDWMVATTEDQIQKLERLLAQRR